MKVDQKAQVATHLLEVLLVAVRKLPDAAQLDHHQLILGVSEMLSDLLFAVTPEERDELLPAILKGIVEGATKQRTTVRVISVTEPSRTQH